MVAEIAPEERKTGRSSVQYSQEDKLEAVSELYFRNESASVVAEIHNVNRVTLYNWKRELFNEELHKPMNKDSNLTKDELQEEVDTLKKEVLKLRMEKELLEGTAELIKKDPGISLADLTNKENTILIDALRNKYPFKEVTQFSGASKE